MRAAKSHPRTPTPAQRATMLADVHQHIWSDPLLDCLQARDTLPMVRRGNGLTILHSAAEAPYVIDAAARVPESRSTLLHQDGLDLSVMAISSPVGIEALPRDDALELIDAHLEGMQTLSGEFAAWGPVALDRPDPSDVDRLVDWGCVGISVPAGALAGPRALEQVGQILETTAARQVPLFVHPGRAPGQRSQPFSLGEPLWWRAVTDYVAQMQAAWFTFQALGRREHPELTVLFAMLAGGAPLLSERLATRGGPPVELRDPRIFYDTSSYGPAAVEMMASQVGESQLLYGSDRPVAEPVANARNAQLQANAGAVLRRVAVPS